MFKKICYLILLTFWFIFSLNNTNESTKKLYRHNAVIKFHEIENNKLTKEFFNGTQMFLGKLIIQYLKIVNPWNVLLNPLNLQIAIKYITSGEEIHAGDKGIGLVLSWTIDK